MDNRFSESVERIETVAGLILWGISSCSMMAGSVWAVREMSRRPTPNQQPLLFFVVAILMNVATVGSAWFLVRGFAAARSPVLLSIAERPPTKRFPEIVIATWWGWHFLSMATAADNFWQEFRAQYTTLPQGIGSTMIRVVVTFSGSAAANMFLLLALAALWRGKPIVRRVYELRFAVDLAIAITLLNVRPEVLLLFRVPFMFLFRVLFRK